jgi:hypothetical protein
MDSWLRWLTCKYNTNKLFYSLGTLYMKLKLPKIFPILFMKNQLKSKKNIKKSIEELNKILKNSVFLVLDLEENIDFDYNDIDEVKMHYKKDYLKFVYAKNSNLYNKKMECWNMHTYSNKNIEKDKMVLLSYNNKLDANIILNKIIEDNIQYVKNNCEFLYRYYIC